MGGWGGEEAKLTHHRQGWREGEERRGNGGRDGEEGEEEGLGKRVLEEWEA